MDFNVINDEWIKDADISLKIDRESISIALLHAKYSNWWRKEKELVEKYDAQYKILKKIKTEYYSGTLDRETIAEKGWKPMNLRILKADIPTYLEADEELIRLNYKLQYAKDNVEYLKDIMRQIANRGFHLNTYVEFQKLQNAVN